MRLLSVTGYTSGQVSDRSHVRTDSPVCLTFSLREGMSVGSRCTVSNKKVRKQIPNVFNTPLYIWSHHSSVGTVTKIQAWHSGVQFPSVARNLYPKHPYLLWGPTQPPLQWVPGALSSGGKPAGDWDWPFFQSSAEITIEWSCTSTPTLYAFVSYTERGQFVEALRYKLEGRGFDSRWCH
jgi:hypothetical protein